MTKPTTKRIKELTAACEPSTSSKADVSEAPQEPLPKRRRGRK